MKNRLIRAIAAALFVPLLYCAPAFAADVQTPNNGEKQHGSPWGRNADYWEVRFGAGAYDFGPATQNEFSGAVINGEILAPSPKFLRKLGAPRPYLGTDIAISDDAIHVIYWGLSWEAYLTQRIYLGLAGGGSWNSSPQTTSASGESKDLGSAFLFHLQASLGFDITSKLTMQIFYNHYSNANMGGSNPGLESIGARLGMRF